MEDWESLDTDVLETDAELESDEAYGPGLFSRLAENRAVVILLVIAFLALVIGPSLYYVLHREPEQPKPRPNRVYPA